MPYKRRLGPRFSTLSSKELASSSPNLEPALESLSPVPKSPSDFWTGGEPRDSPASSQNSSLHGRPVFDPQEQNPNFMDVYDPKLSATFATNPVLPPPPVELGKTLGFNCDLCGQGIQVKRRLDWQWVPLQASSSNLTDPIRKHVMKDLRPYLCTLPDCPVARKTYTSPSAFLDHENQGHEVQSGSLHQDEIIACLFCGEPLKKAETAKRARHIGRHMEEIAFSVVTKPYEEWEFYSDSSDKSDSIVQRCERINHATGEACNEEFMSTDDLQRHETAMHDHYRCERVDPSTGKSCTQLFKNAHDLTRHEDTIHRAAKHRVRCQVCTKERTFRRNDALLRHMRVVHGGGDIYKIGDEPLLR